MGKPRRSPPKGPPPKLPSSKPSASQSPVLPVSASPPPPPPLPSSLAAPAPKVRSNSPVHSQAPAAQTPAVDPSTSGIAIQTRENPISAAASATQPSSLLQGKYPVGAMETPPPPEGRSSPPQPQPQGSLAQSASPPQKGSWISVVQEAPVPGLQLQPDFVITNGVARISIPDEVIADALPLWKSFIVGHFMGDVPHVGTIHATVNRIWTVSDRNAKIDVQVINKTTVLFRITNSTTRDRVLKRKYWYIADIPLVVNEWNPEVAQAPPDLSAMPMWVDLRGVPGYLFSHEGLELLSSTAGKFVKLHPTTERCHRLDVARILVEVNLQKDLTEKISFMNGKGEEVLVSVSYPWLPPKCKLCSCWGHKEKECSKVVRVTLLQQNKVTSTGNSTADEGVDSATVQQLAQSLLQDLEKTTPLQAHKEDSVISSQDSRWTVVKRRSGSASPKRSEIAVLPESKTVSPPGFRVLQIEDEDEDPTGDTQAQVACDMMKTSNSKLKVAEEGELTESGDVETETVAHEEEVVGLKVSETVIGKATKTGTGRHRSRSRGLPKPIANRPDLGPQVSKKASSRK